MKKRGLIALDIDGTLTADLHSVPQPVVDYLHELEEAGFAIVFVTGRPYPWAAPVLSQMRFPCYAALHNGAFIMQLPDEKIVLRRYLDRAILEEVERICAGYMTDCVLYTGHDNGDVCYWRPERFSSSVRKYLQGRIEALHEKWVEVESFDDVGVEQFPSLKCFGKEDTMLPLAEKLEKMGLHIPLIRDSFDPSFYIGQATNAKVDKGQAVRDCLKLNGMESTVIAAGNDNNDLPMMEVATIKVVMGNAPPNVRAVADIIAPDVEQMGIIEGLRQAIERI